MDTCRRKSWYSVVLEKWLSKNCRENVSRRRACVELWTRGLGRAPHPGLAPTRIGHVHTDRAAGTPILSYLPAGRVQPVPSQGRVRSGPHVTTSQPSSSPPSAILTCSRHGPSDRVSRFMEGPELWDGACVLRVSCHSAVSTLQRTA